jgi:Flp pilus assembly protein TadD
VAAVVVAYHNSLSIPFFFDDLPGIERNVSLRHPAQWLFPPVDASGATGRPLVNFTLGLNYAAGQLGVTGYHVFNLLIHGLAGLALFGVVRRTLLLPEFQRPPDDATGKRSHAADATAIALATALLWGVHPLLTESVNCVIQRNELLVGLFYLLTVYGFIRSVGPEGKGRWQTVSVIACFLGVLSKEVMATAPLVVLLYDRWFVAGSFRAAWSARARFYGALFASWLLLAFLIAGSAQRTGTVGFGLGVSSWEYLLTQCRAIVLYLKLAIWPAPLVVDYGYSVNRSLGEVLPQALFLVSLAAATLWAGVRRRPWGFIPACFFLVLGPSSSVVPLTTQTIAEHRMYLPLAGLVVATVLAAYRWLGYRGLVAFFAVAAVFGVVTIVRNQAYGSALSIWSDTVAKWPENARARTNLGNALARSGRIPDALPHYTAAIRIDPKYQEAHANLGLALLQAGRPAEALPPLGEALKLRPGDTEAERNLGEALANLNRMPEALEHFRRAAELAPHHPRNVALHGWALLLSSRASDAVPVLTRAAQLQPDSPDVHIDLANALTIAGRPAESLPHFEAAARLRPGDANIHFNWAQSLLRAGRRADAAVQFAEVVRLRPDDAEARALLEKTRQAAGLR